jgi:hypothetical protein
MWAGSAEGIPQGSPRCGEDPLRIWGSVADPSNSRIRPTSIHQQCPPMRTAGTRPRRAHRRSVREGTPSSRAASASSSRRGSRLSGLAVARASGVDMAGACVRELGSDRPITVEHVCQAFTGRAAPRTRRIVSVRQTERDQALRGPSKARPGPRRARELLELGARSSVTGPRVALDRARVAPSSGAQGKPTGAQ